MNLVTNTQEQNMIFTNTASVVYEIEADDFYKNSSLFDQKIQNLLIQSIKKWKMKSNGHMKRSLWIKVKDVFLKAIIIGIKATNKKQKLPIKILLKT